MADNSELREDVHHDHDHGHDHHHDHHHDHDHGHDHHHDHDHGHHHDHDHDHHHHDHDHDHHHHDHDHDHHHHDHDHEHHHHELVSISHHESAVIAALQGVIPIADYDDAEKHLAEKMREAGRRVTEAGGIIGHIKFILTSAGKCGQISVTDIDETVRHFDGNSCRAEGVAIVFAVEDDELRTIMTETVGSLLENSEL